MSSLSYAEQLRNDLFRAYEDARKNKRNTIAQLEFEKDAEHNLIELYHELLDGSYVPGKSICFLTHFPVLREVFASQFRDRVVHHLLFNYILKLDIQGYFMSINKNILYGIIYNKLMKQWEEKGKNCNIPGKNPEFILFLVESIIFKDHTLDCEVMGNKKEWMLLPASKSLFCQPKGIGLPIGDLTSQLFSNIYLNEFDNMIKRRFKIRHYGRYVDDFYVVHPSKAYLKSLIPEIRTFLKERLGLTLHPKKIYLQPYTHGVAFLGAFVKPYRKYAIPRSVNNFRSKAKKIISFSTRDELTIGQLEAIQASLNSYLGYLGHYKSYKIIHKSLTGSAVFKHLYFASGYKKSIPYKRYTNKRRERCEIAHDLNRILTA